MKRIPKPNKHSGHYGVPGGQNAANAGLYIETFLFSDLCPLTVLFQEGQPIFAEIPWKEFNFEDNYHIT